MKHSTRFPLAMIVVGLCCNLSAAQETQPAISAVMPKEQMAVFKKYCYDCHDAETQEGKLDLEHLSFEISKDASTAEHWDNVLAALNSKEMPPEESTQIPNDEKAAFLNALSEQMVLARKILGDSGGEITMRRMNRREYQNTLEALLGFRPDVSTLPDDDATGGFDTAGGSLFFSSDQFEQYRATATRALAYALNSKTRPKPRTVRVEGEMIPAAYEERAKEKREAFKRAKTFLAQDEKTPEEFGFEHREQAMNIVDKNTYSMAVYDNYFFDRPESKTGTILLPGRHNGPVKQMPRLMVKTWYPGGTYKLRIKAASYGNAKDQHRYVQVQFQSGKSEFTHLQGLARVTGTVKNPQLIEFELRNPVGVKGAFRVRQRHYEEPWRYKLDIQQKAKNGIGSLPAVWVDYVEVDGPYFGEQLQQLPSMLKRNDGVSDEQYARTVITQFATKAFRNKAPDGEYVDKLVRYYLNRHGAGDDTRAAMIKSLALVLSSPSFVYLVEPGKPDEEPVELENKQSSTATAFAKDSRKLSDRELAIRLAYFLWSSPPDESLLAAAENGSLSDPKVLRAQTSRLIRDARFDRFVSGFAHQWLDMKRIDMFDFSAIDFPEFDESVRRSARLEVYKTIRHVMDLDLPISNLLKTDFVIVNDVLSDFYGLTDSTERAVGQLTKHVDSDTAAASSVGSEFRKVLLPADSPRGGLLGTAAIHIMGSDGQRSSPVERGAWVLRHLLNDPPPPAPPNIPMLEHGDAVLAIRDLQKRHQEEPQCASCHRKIDPIGYGLENFNAAGIWREVEEVKIPVSATGKRKRKPTSTVKQFPIDPSGKLPGGERFGSYGELRDNILTHYHDAFARGFSENLIAYSLGRSYGISDHNLATSITSEAAENGYTISAFIHALVQSRAFHVK